MAINKVEFGGQTLIDLTADTITTADLMQNKTAHDKAGNSIKGAFTLDTELTAQDSKIAAIKEALKNKGTPPAEKPVIKPLNVTSNGTYNVPAGTDGYNPVKVNCPTPKIEQIKTVDVTANGTVSIKPDAGKVLSEAIAKVNVPTGGNIEEKSFSFRRIDTNNILGNFLFLGTVDGAPLAFSYDLLELMRHEEAIFSNNRNPALIIVGDIKYADSNGLILECSDDIFTIVAIPAMGNYTVLPYEGAYYAPPVFTSFYITPKISGAVATNLVVGQNV